NSASSSRTINVSNAGHYSASISPTTAVTGSSTGYALTVTNTTPIGTLALNGVSIAIPAGAGTPSSMSVTATNPGSVTAVWQVDNTAPAGFIEVARSNSSSYAIV